jgi:copper resistance protein B
MSWKRRFGDTADYARAHGEDAGEWRWLAGIRVWF